MNVSRAYRRRNPRFDRHFSVELIADSEIFSGYTSSISAYGASIEISEAAHTFFSDQRNSGVVKVSTALNDLEGEINALWITGDKFFLGLKLLHGRNWYN